MPSVRQQVYRFLTSKTFHYTVLLVVTLDVGCMFADIVINLETCGHKNPKADTALEALKYISLVFSSLFMLELLASIWAFGRSYFTSKFHIFDASIIIISFMFEITLQGIEEEVASLIIILRLLRVIKIVDEISVGAEEQMKDLEDRLNESERDVRALREEVGRLRKSQNDDV
ncbi:hypothetical protein K458DRAFT_286130 [Lentithecium fluviatile CBS 122367]|uniref:Voltage-gated hydrogen channel 1 n=1 Tax=Lentithecium fluviatile CBS 122367 TaxID=1168545 RepID=A0A6G1JNR9_9PLEO|nr:hypothetical protein K458DRAFT_286130 [Lentithecium fluviatile CBS 122367]